MAYRGRRLIDRFLLAGGALALGGAAAVGAAVADGERVDGYWASATVGPDGGAAITEVIDYDFGLSDRHGIFRDVPGLDPAAPIEVDSPTAPDMFIVQPGTVDTRIRIGDPDQTISGRHRYRIDYPIGLAPVSGGSGSDQAAQVSWNAVGAQWPVGIRNIEVHLVAGRRLTDVQCSRGETGAWDGCTADQPEPGHLVVTVDELDSFQGVTLSATPTGPPVPAVTVTPPTGAAQDPGTGIIPPAATAAGVALLAAAAGSVAVRRAGKELVWAGGSADAAYGPQFDENYPVRRVDHDELNNLASTEFAPPKELTAWQGGVLYAEHADSDHQVAWLLERAIAGEVEIEGSGKDVTLRLLDVDSPHHAMLTALFGGRRTVDLGSYDKQFAAGWKRLHKNLDGWHRDGPYWDPSGDRRRTGALMVGIPLLVLGLIGTVGFAAAANRAGLLWLIGVGVAAAVAGAGLALMARSWELRIRTPEGSGLWILIESFRRFIHNSDAQHVEAAAKQGVLLDYTAWAVALDEADEWSKAVEAADLDQSSVGARALYLTAMAPNLGRATSAAATAPSSGGGGGGSVGGGGGGGGGGSW